MKQLFHIGKALLFLAISIFFSFCLVIPANAEAKDIELQNQETKNVTLYVGDTGKIILNTSNVISDNNVEYKYYTMNSYIVEVNETTGEYKALTTGTIDVNVEGYNESGFRVFYATACITVQVDMTNVTLSADSLTGYLSPYYYNKKPQYSGDVHFTLTINSDFPIGENNENNENNYYDDYYERDNSDILTCTSSNPAISADVSVANNILDIYVSSSKGGATILTLTIYGKEFPISINLIPLTISKQSCLLAKNKKVTLTVGGCNLEDITWTSSNPSVATVNSKGVVKGKKIGNTLIKAKVGDAYLGCIVSVTHKKLIKVVERASYIGTHWKYSQPKRTLKGYYDCSALVWKAYTQYTNINFGSKGYPGVALTEALWCKSHGRMIKGGMTWKKVNKLQINPGDLLFKSTYPKKPYKDIYHVEMFTGYYCHGVSSEGVASYSINWAARGSYYSWDEKSLLGRPMK